jgi:hypothetical protein
MFEHFAGMYPDAGGLSFGSDRFKAIGVDASSILDDKIFAFLHLDLNDSTFTYRCQNHNLGDDYLIVEIINPTLEDLDKNDCRILNQLINEKEFAVYESKYLGFQIEYPQEFEVNELFNDTSSKIIDSRKDQVLVGVSDKVEFSSDLSKFYKSPDIPFSFRIKTHESISTIDEIIDMVKNNPPFPLETTKLGGVEAWRGTIGNESDFHDAHSILTIYENKTYNIFFVFPKDQTDKYMSIIDHIIDSFEFEKFED